jgi:hypothetical protein
MFQKANLLFQLSFDMFRHISGRLLPSGSNRRVCEGQL